MDEKPLINTCNLREVNPIMMALPWPEIRVKEKNQSYANLLSIDYCGSVSELSAITQYINHENRLSCEKCPMIQTILGIAMAEMVHLQKLGELMFLLGGKIDFVAKHRDGKMKMWTPQELKLPETAREMIMADIEGERSAIGQYQKHIKMINDEFVVAVLARIIKDEEYHIAILKSLL